MCLKSHHCLCGIHVHVGTRAVAIWGLALHGISVLINALMHYNTKDTIFSTATDFIIYWIMFSLNLSLLLGNLYRKPSLYWPYLLFMVSVLLMSIIFVAGVVLFGTFAIFVGDFSKLEQHKINIDFLTTSHVTQLQNSTETVTKSTNVNSLHNKMEMILMLAVISGILTLNVIVQGYLLSVVFRGYRFLKELRASNTPTNQLELYEQKY